MTKKEFFKIRLYFTAIIAVSIWSLLAWNHYHGGVPSHHLAANKDLPAISNGWGALVLPLLAWFLTYRIQRRIFDNREGSQDPKKYFLPTLVRFAGALLFGIAISTCFSLGYSEITDYLVLGLLPLALFFPIYRAECLLGFVMAMTVTFGAILPTGFGLFLVLVSLVLYRYIRPVIRYIFSKLALLATSSKHKPQQ
ncbi:hypothetical protein ACD591_20465 [Rufibacter glacialis]|uniref:Uncharacterized protein n=1 Tax=Rufibacter glacialis TaxID=1259555 RepID=A0A5M8Q8K8_9BACT|nr:hypothetical protein [Rufibacter glacialis]KAA6432267.1 hypothetical protein FOE74_14235 [Rufibacter glacialis]